tara:strand:- start:638 stop:829 length:192 start_codon:yes stop_codon:yes gene_type:complete
MTRDEKLALINKANKVLFDEVDFTINNMQPDNILDIEVVALLEAALRHVQMLERRAEESSLYY